MIEGAVLSATNTSKVHCEELPAWSVAVQGIVVIPVIVGPETGLWLTLILAGRLQLSLTVAPEV